MRTRKFMLILSLVICTIPKPVFAQPFALAGPGPGGPPLPMSLMMLIRHANLTPEQQTRVHQIMGANFSQAQPLMKQLKQIHDQIGDKLMTGGTVTAADIEPLQQRENRIDQQLDQQALSAALQIRGLLTPQQLSRVAILHNKLKSLREQMDALMGGGAPVMIWGGPLGS